MAQLYLGISSVPAPLGANFEVGVFVSADGQDINAIEAQLDLPATVELVSLSTGNSITSLWVESPHLVDHSIVFSGVIPGGYTGERGQLFTATLKAVDDGSSTLAFSKERILLNDGEGSPAVLTRAPLVFSIQDGLEISAYKPADDTEPPEIFTPQIVEAPEMGGRILIFSAVDKGLGVERYEVRERGGDWTRATSPYLFQHQTGQVSVQVKAIDYAGNVRLAKAATGPVYLSASWLIIWGILLAIGMLTLAFKPWRVWLRKVHARRLR